MRAGRSAAIDFDVAALRAYLQELFADKTGETQVERVAGGQSNPTYFVDFGRRRLVLRKKPVGDILPGAHAIEREFRVMKALGPTDVPVPEVLALCEDSSVLGTPFYLMRRLEGRVFHDCALPGLSPEARRAIYLAMAEALARLHAVDPAELGLGDFGPPGNYFERQFRRWSRQYAQSPGERIAALDEVCQWLAQNMPPEEERRAIAHGDFRLGNLMFHPQRAEVIGILDWELATLGHPLADLGFACIAWRSAPEEYGGLLGLDLAALGIPCEKAFVAHYFAHAAPTSPLGRFHVVFALFRFAVIFVGIAERARTGTAAAHNAREVAPLAAKFAERARQAMLAS
ncbi:phosphotransferase family protein [Afifella pfennigii]|uniref:phosphotransferase family protein n=1 Tax=Afifella pfennigii TaxID=209897 RepID=UPI00054D252B|nr:phosphotransferase family protein [Afifella pfennigii]